MLAFTADGWGDGKNATIGKFDVDGRYTVLNVATNCDIARIYRYMTLLLGMKPSEHEYKVMGLAPYGREEYAAKAVEVFRSALHVEGLEFNSTANPTDSYYWFKDRLEGMRFDNLAWALQTWVEELLESWVRNAIEKYGINDVVFSGGVAMNVKAMGRLAQLSEVNQFFVGGSAADESHVISTLFAVYEEVKRDWSISSVENLDNLFLGPTTQIDEEKAAVKLIQQSIPNVKLLCGVDLESVAEKLIEGKIVARCAGRGEFGQRALGNRSILADPINSDARDKINKAVKNRDFWMPFAPIILSEFASDYLVNPKKLISPYMTLAFDTTDLGFEQMKAACHPSDRTCRAQILDANANLELNDLLHCFSKKTGRGALLNTSFNLHGFPIVNSPIDAANVFINSGIDVLVFENHVIEKSAC